MKLSSSLSWKRATRAVVPVRFITSCAVHVQELEKRREVQNKNHTNTHLPFERKSRAKPIVSQRLSANANRHWPHKIHARQIDSVPSWPAMDQSSHNVITQCSCFCQSASFFWVWNISFPFSENRKFCHVGRRHQKWVEFESPVQDYTGPMRLGERVGNSRESVGEYTHGSYASETSSPRHVRKRFYEAILRILIGER